MRSSRVATAQCVTMNTASEPLHLATRHSLPSRSTVLARAARAAADGGAPLTEPRTAADPRGTAPVLVATAERTSAATAGEYTCVPWPSPASCRSSPSLSSSVAESGGGWAASSSPPSPPSPSSPPSSLHGNERTNARDVNGRSRCERASEREKERARKNPH